jgi:hypothetical protein
MAETPIFDGLRKTIADARPLVVGKLVIELYSVRVPRFEREVDQLGLAVHRHGDWYQIEIDGATIAWRHG